MRKLMFLNKGIYFLKHFLSCGIFDKWTTKEKLSDVVLSLRELHEHDQLCIVS